jgi:hypothetical protein
MLTSLKTKNSQTNKKEARIGKDKLMCIFNVLFFNTDGENRCATYMLQADTISKKMASPNGISFSLIVSARTRTLDGWPPLLRALIKAEQAIVSGMILFVSSS